MARSTASLRSRLAVLREARDITQKQLADAAGVSRQTIVAIERGDYSPSTALALRIALLLEATVEQIFALPEAEVAELVERRGELRARSGEANGSGSEP